MRRSPKIVAISLVAFAWAMPAVAAGDPEVKPGTVLTIKPNDSRADKEQVYYTITLEEARLASATPGQAYVGRNDGRLQSFEIKDWSFERVAKIDSFTVKQKVKPVGTSDLTMKRGTSAGSGGLPGKMNPPTVILKRGRAAEPAAGLGKQLEAQDKMGNAPASTGIGNKVAEGNEDQALDRPTFGEKFMGRLNKFGSIDGALPPDGVDPPPQGSLRVKVKLPWLGCEEGKFYPKLIIGKPVKVYTLSDVTVTGCFRDGATFSYSKVEFERAKPH